MFIVVETKYVQEDTICDEKEVNHYCDTPQEVFNIVKEIADENSIDLDELSDEDLEDDNFTDIEEDLKGIVQIYKVEQVRNMVQFLKGSILD